MLLMYRGEVAVEVDVLIVRVRDLRFEVQGVTLNVGRCQLRHSEIRLHRRWVHSSVLFIQELELALRTQNIPGHERIHTQIVVR
jgi:hypothetical protein